ncbi:ABC transporter ATP-binding protein [Staphylococcus simulans]|uniref:ABC transporter ATP-binding protein n=1 Tax=Staphylococcus TaxID=1279 RepID=UPI000709841E|nr:MULTISPECIES: ABC transporter ATP-binding protein [Staphylococcus]MDU0419192.1 ABC transporter ATP-binding protein [Staphylococcus simulans]MDU0466308.1 ABC transporter ATP-binding protein [Staphylococcus simulans]OFJ80804.1 peptide ABC transporter ATP-binding protein [Staphylococcus sp. HMSC056G08]PNZ42086.1 peptide ABC transporter ATP-binding protein [Staphylococcus simulans]PTI96875.1 ABC transporter ATP-binding protein [Staphylococcus simulans]
MNKILEIKNLYIDFHLDNGVVQAVRNVSLDLEEGETLAIVGESGSGKSVLTKAITKLLPPRIAKIKEGSVIFENKNLVDLTNKELQSIRGKEISMIFQDPMTALNPTMKIGKQITELLKVHKGIGHNEAKQEAIKVLESVGVPNAEKRFNYYPHQFSGGQRQRIVIAMALILDPKIIIADEPTTALDVSVQAKILELFKALQQEYKTSIIFITHDLGVVANVADKVAVMYAGEIVEYGTVNEIFYDPKHPYTWGLLGSMPHLETDKSVKLASIPGSPPDLMFPPVGDAFARRSDYAMDIDFEQAPPTYQFSKTHYAKSWLYHEATPAFEVPDAVKVLNEEFEEETFEKPLLLQVEEESKA